MWEKVDMNDPEKEFVDSEKEFVRGNGLIGYKIRNHYKCNPVSV
jgi:hypothetical protein